MAGLRPEAPPNTAPGASSHRVRKQREGQSTTTISLVPRQGLHRSSNNKAQQITACLTHKKQQKKKPLFPVARCRSWGSCAPSDSNLSLQAYYAAKRLCALFALSPSAPPPSCKHKHAGDEGTRGRPAAPPAGCFQKISRFNLDL